MKNKDDFMNGIEYFKKKFNEIKDELTLKV